MSLRISGRPRKKSIIALLLTGSLSTLAACNKNEAPPAPRPVAPTMQSPPSSPSLSPSSGSGTSPAASAPTVGANADGEAVVKKSDCLSCHAIDKKLIGPPYSWVAYRYKDDLNAPAILSARIKSGSTGRWTEYTGGVAMTPHPQLSDAELKAMVQWILSQKAVAPPKP